MTHTHAPDVRLGQADSAKVRSPRRTGAKVHGDPTDAVPARTQGPQDPGPHKQFGRPAWAVCVGVVGAVALAWLLPATGLPEHYHAFADQRPLGEVPNAWNVWSNLPFALFGVWLVWQLERLWAVRQNWMRGRGGLGASSDDPSSHLFPPKNQIQGLDTRLLGLLALTALGLLLTAVCSSAYHWHPHDAGLCLDRVGMSLAFAGVLGLAVADRIHVQLGCVLAALLLVLGPWAAWWAWQAENMTPWAVLQGAGLLLLVAFSVTRASDRHGAAQLNVAWWGVLLAYAVAKGLELGDHAIWQASGEWVSGHSLKHAVAALAALPVLVAVQRQLRLGQSHPLQGAREAAAPHGQNLTPKPSAPWRMMPSHQPAMPSDAVSAASGARTSPRRKA